MPDGKGINMDVDLIEREASNIRQYASNLEGVAGALDELVRTTPGMWTGEASEAFVTILKKDGITSVTNMYDVCLEMASFLEKAAEYVRTTDSKVSSAFEGVAGN